MNDFTTVNYAHRPWHNRCIFTGATIENNKRGEHVLPRWLVKDYKLKGTSLEFGSKQAIAQISEFTAPALEDANNLFGELENRIKQNQTAVSDDELHLWLMKISSGLLWNHCRLAQNNRHPKAPVPIDERLEGILSKDFQSGFFAWQNNTYVRKGSFLRVPSSVKSLFIAHSFGAHIDTAFSATHDAILPYALIAFGRPNHDLLIATCEFRYKLDTHSTTNWTAIPEQTGHLVHGKLDSKIEM